MRQNRYNPPKKDSPEAVASARMLLMSARSIDGFTAEWLARCYNLSIERAEYELTVARQKRDVDSV